MIVVMAIIGAGIAFAYASTLPSLYRSTSSVFVASQRGETTSELVQGNTFTQAQVQSYAQLAQLPIVTQRVVAELGLAQTPEQFAGSISADIRLNTVIIDITVTNSSAEVAATIADAVTRSLASVAEDLAPRSDRNEPAITMTTVSSARVPSAPFSPNSRFIVLTGAGIGLALGVLYALAREMLDTRVRAEKDLSRVSGAPLLGRVMRRKRKTTSAIVMRSGPYTPAAEAFRRIATNLEFIDVDVPVRSVVVTSALPGEGKSSTSINLALAMAERLERVLIIDGDLRKPSIAEYCQIDGSVGLTSVLVGSASLEDAVRPWADGLVDVLPAGTIPANPSQMLGSDAMSRLVEDLVSRYDFVVVDAPPLLPVTDPLTLAKLTDGALVVARFKVVRRQQLAQSLQSLEAVSARLLGLVLNGTKPERGQAYYGRTPEEQLANEVGAQGDAEAAHDYEGAAARGETSAPSLAPVAIESGHGGSGELEHETDVVEPTRKGEARPVGAAVQFEPNPQQSADDRGAEPQWASADPGGVSVVVAESPDRPRQDHLPAAASDAEPLVQPSARQSSEVASERGRERTGSPDLADDDDVGLDTAPAIMPFLPVPSRRRHEG